MTKMTKNIELTAWLGAGGLAGLLILGVPFTAAAAQDTSATRQDTAAVQQETTTQAAGNDTARADSVQWGRTADRDPEVQNPPGYRGMERPVNVFPPDTADTSSAGDATSRTSQMQRQDTISSENQNPPGYRGMERLVGTDTTAAKQGDTEFIGTSSEPTVRAKWNALLKAAVKQPNPTPELRDAINNLRKQEGAEAQKTKKAGTKKKATTTKKQATDRDSASTVRAGQDTTGDTTRFEVNAQEGNNAAGTTGERPSGDSVNIGPDSTASER